MAAAAPNSGVSTLYPEEIGPVLSLKLGTQNKLTIYHEQVFNKLHETGQNTQLLGEYIVNLSGERDLLVHDRVCLFFKFKVFLAGHHDKFMEGRALQNKQFRVSLFCEHQGRRLDVLDADLPLTNLVVVNADLTGWDLSEVDTNNSVFRHHIRDDIIPSLRCREVRVKQQRGNIGRNYKNQNSSLVSLSGKDDSSSYSYSYSPSPRTQLNYENNDLLHHVTPDQFSEAVKLPPSYENVSSSSHSKTGFILTSTVSSSGVSSGVSSLSTSSYENISSSWITSQHDVPLFSSSTEGGHPTTHTHEKSSVEQDHASSDHEPKQHVRKPSLPILIPAPINGTKLSKRNTENSTSIDLQGSANLSSSSAFSSLFGSSMNDQPNSWKSAGSESLTDDYVDIKAETEGAETTTSTEFRSRGKGNHRKVHLGSVSSTKEQTVRPNGQPPRAHLKHSISMPVCSQVKEVPKAFTPQTKVIYQGSEKEVYCHFIDRILRKLEDSTKKRSFRRYFSSHKDKDKDKDDIKRLIPILVIKQDEHSEFVDAFLQTKGILKKTEIETSLGVCFHTFFKVKETKLHFNVLEFRVTFNLNIEVVPVVTVHVRRQELSQSQLKKVEENLD